MATEIHAYQNHAKQGLPLFDMKNKKETQWDIQNEVFFFLIVENKLCPSTMIFLYAND